MAFDSQKTEGFKQIGTRPDRPDGVDKVTGRARFGADMTAPGMLWGVIVRSPHAHARIVKIDTSKAEAMEGVKAVVTGPISPMRSHRPLACGERCGTCWKTLWQAKRRSMTGTRSRLWRRHRSWRRATQPRPRRRPRRPPRPRRPRPPRHEKCIFTNVILIERQKT